MQTQIVQPTRRNTPRRLRDASREEARQATACSLGIGLGLGMGSALSGTPSFYPTDKTGGYFFLDGDQPTSFTPGGTLKSGGGATGVVTITGTKNATTMGALRIECTSSTLFRWGYDNNGTTATWIQTGQTIPNGAGSFVLGTTGFTAAFSSATYANGNTFEETVAGWKEQFAAVDFTQATAVKQPRLIKAVNSCYGCAFDGSNDTLRNTLLSLIRPTGAAPVWVWMVAIQNATPAQFNCIMGTPNPGVRLQAASTTTIQLSEGGNGTPGTVATADPMRIIAKWTGSTEVDVLKIKSTSVTIAVHSGDVGVLPAGVWLGSRGDDAGTFMPWTLCSIGAWPVDVTGANLTALENWGIAKYGAGLF